MRIAISGSSSGLGLALSSELSGLGHAVFGCGSRSSSRTHEQVDVTDRDAVSLWAGRIGTTPFDMIIANAAVAVSTRPAAEITESELRHVLDVNVVGVFNMFTEFAPYASDHCVFIAMSSQWGIGAPRRGQSAYCASKFAVEGLVSAWRHELRHGQRVYALDPGAGIGTPMMAAMTPTDVWPGDPDSADKWATGAKDFLLHLADGPQGPLHVRVPSAAE